MTTRRTLLVGGAAAAGLMTVGGRVSAQSQPISISILDAGTGKTVTTLKNSAEKAGLNQVVWNLQANGQAVQPGEYIVLLETGGGKQYKSLRIDTE